MAASLPSPFQRSPHITTRPSNLTLVACTLLLVLLLRQPAPPQPAAVMPPLVLEPAVIDRVRGALWGVYIADALSMPVHWCVWAEALRPSAA